MKLVRETIIILLFVFLGEFINKVLQVPIPGNILGMLLLLISLITGFVKLKSVESFAQFLSQHLALFFIPARVGLIAITGMLKDSWYILLFISVVSTFIVMITTAYAVKFLRRFVK